MAASRWFGGEFGLKQRFLIPIKALQLTIDASGSRLGETLCESSSRKQQRTFAGELPGLSRRLSAASPIV